MFFCFRYMIYVFHDERRFKYLIYSHSFNSPPFLEDSSFAMTCILSSCTFFPPLLGVWFYWWLVSFHHLWLINIVQFIILVNVSFSPYVWLGFYLFFSLYFNLSYKPQTKVRTIYSKHFLSYVLNWINVLFLLLDLGIRNQAMQMVIYRINNDHEFAISTEGTIGQKNLIYIPKVESDLCVPMGFIVLHLYPLCMANMGHFFH